MCKKYTPPALIIYIYKRGVETLSKKIPVNKFFGGRGMHSRPPPQCTECRIYAIISYGFTSTDVGLLPLWPPKAD